MTKPNAEEKNGFGDPIQPIPKEVSHQVPKVQVLKTGMFGGISQRT